MTMKIPSSGVPAPSSKEPTTGTDATKSADATDATAATKSTTEGVTSFAKEAATKIADATSSLATSIMGMFRSAGLGLDPVKSPLSRESTEATAEDAGTSDGETATKATAAKAETAAGERTPTTERAETAAGERTVAAEKKEATAEDRTVVAEKKEAADQEAKTTASRTETAQEGAVAGGKAALERTSAETPDAPETRAAAKAASEKKAADLKQSVPPELQSRVVGPKDKAAAEKAAAVRAESAQTQPKPNPWRDVAMALASYSKAGGESVGRTVMQLIETFSTAQKVLLVDTVTHLKRADYDTANTAWKQLGPSVFTVNVNGMIQHVLRYSFVDGSGALQGVVSQVSTSADPKAGKKLQDKLAGVGDEAKSASDDLNRALEQQKDTLQTMAGVSKMLYDSAMDVIRHGG